MPTITSLDGTSIVYDQVGSGPPLIMVNGASALRGDSAEQAAALAPSFTVITYDRRGRGESGDTTPYAVEREVEDIAALVAHAGGAAYVAGFSSGAILALEAARHLGQSVITKLALYEPPFIIDDSRTPMAPDHIARMKANIAAGRPGDTAAMFMTFVGMPEEAVAGMRQSPAWPHMEAVAPSLVYDAIICEDYEQGDPAALQRFATTTVPTLVMDGDTLLGSVEAHVWMRNGNDAIAAILPNARRQTLAGQDHGSSVEALTPALTAFFLD